MTIDEAIKHCEEIAMDKTNLAQTLWDSKEKARCEDCAEEHNQLAQWLIELKMLKTEQEPCEDAISRKVLISHIENQSREWGEDYDAQQILGDIEDLPPVNPQEPKWIPVSERLPEDGQIVLVCQTYSWQEFEDGTEVTIAQYKRKHFTWYRYQKDWDKHTSIMTHGDICPGNVYVIAWMPLPEPYKLSENPTDSKDVIWHDKRNYSEIVVEPHERSDKE